MWCTPMEHYSTERFDPCSQAAWWICYAVGGILLAYFGLLVLCKGIDFATFIAVILTFTFNLGCMISQGLLNRMIDMKNRMLCRS